ncbi:hypothetical protein EYF80_054397 [Liparis tanakae]|uniref:Uncharacterized protein n=1 Tax=Liparis tanakae TaxID=230148 RepID=A0A4Z2F2I1_9TELE|nr:hypothetical protein EYF80_054397 [Liparis tanakae]
MKPLAEADGGALQRAPKLERDEINCRAVAVEELYPSAGAPGREAETTHEGQAPPGGGHVYYNNKTDSSQLLAANE